MKYLIAGLILIMAHVCAAKVPSWAKDHTISKTGDYVTSICEGKGPSVAVARQDAIQNCQLSVSQFLNGEVKLNSVSVETEKDIGFHQQIEQNLTVKNFVCNPVKDEIEQNEDSYNYWIKCKFNLSKVESVKTEEAKLAQNNNLGLEAMSTLKSSNIIVDGKVLILETIPQCDSILVKGSKARTIKCKTNPLKVVLYENDQSLIIRLKDFQPKTINLKGMKDEKLSVLLERN